MKLPLSLISLYVDISKITPAEFCERMTASGSKVEGFKILDDGDAVVEFEITPNRIDCFSAIGIAREAAATFNLNFKTFNNLQFESNLNFLDEKLIKISTSNEKLCPRYALSIFTDVTVSQSSDFIQDRLKKCGIKPINNFVDITNYIMIELGQPMHVYDLDKIDGNILVRYANENEETVTLDGVVRKLTNRTPVICDDNKILGIGGIMGGESTKITDNTKNVLFEAAAFDSEIIRQASKTLKLKTDASSLFEKNISALQYNELAIKRASFMIESFGYGKFSGVSRFGSIYENNKTVKFEPERINAFLGSNIEASDMKNIFERLEFKLENDQLIIPEFRMDIDNFFDTTEEVARIYGYNNIKTRKLYASVDVAGRTKMQEFLEQTRQNIAAFGYFEIVTNPFANTEIDNRLGFNASCQNFFEKECSPAIIKNPLGDGSSKMRANSLVTMIQILMDNLNNGNHDLKLFEIGRRYFKTENSFSERRTLSIALSPGEFYDIKQIISVLHNSGVEIFYELNSGISLLHPGKSAKIFVDNKLIGFVGEMSAKVSCKLDIQQKIMLAELDILNLFETLSSKIKYAPISVFPEVAQDISFVVDREITIWQIERVLSSFRSPIVESFKLFDIYEGEQIAKDKKSVSYRIIFRASDHTLTDEEVSLIFSSIYAALSSQLGAEIRG